MTYLNAPDRCRLREDVAYPGALRLPGKLIFAARPLVPTGFTAVRRRVADVVVQQRAVDCTVRWC